MEYVLLCSFTYIISCHYFIQLVMWPLLSQYNATVLPPSMCPTWRRHLRDASAVGAISEARLVVIDVLHLDDELGLRFQRDACQSVHSLSSQCVVGLLLSGNQSNTAHSSECLLFLVQSTKMDPDESGSAKWHCVMTSSWKRLCNTIQSKYLPQL